MRSFFFKSLAGLDFDIEQEQQRTYTFLPPDKTENYLNPVICGNIQKMSAGKFIVKTCVREAILDNDSITITYNFTVNYTKYKILQKKIKEIKRQSVKRLPAIKTGVRTNSPRFAGKTATPHFVASLFLLSVFK